MITIYHNPRCGKSRECIAFFENSKHEFKIIKYIENPLNFEELQLIIKKLNCKPIDLVRIKESIWIEKYKNVVLSDNEVIQAIVDHTILMERPLAVTSKKAVIARPLGKIQSIL